MNGSQRDEELKGASVTGRFQVRVPSKRKYPWRMQRLELWCRTFATSSFRDVRSRTAVAKGREEEVASARTLVDF